MYLESKKGTEMTPFYYLFTRLLRNFLGSYLLFCVVFMINFLAMHLELAEKNRFLIFELMEHVARITLAHSYILAPLALLMSSCVTYTLLQAQMEICAFLTQGVSRFQLLKPILYISLSLMVAEGVFYCFYDLENEERIESGSVIGSHKTNKSPVQVLELAQDEKILYACNGKKEAYLFKKDGGIYFSNGFLPASHHFLAKGIFIQDKQGCKLENLDPPLYFTITIKSKILNDPSKPFQILLILIIPVLIANFTFRFDRNIRPLMILGKTSILYLASHITVKSLCHILSRLI